MTKHPLPRYGLVAAALILTAASPLAAQPAAEPGESDELPRIVISDPNRDLFRLALPDASGEGNLSRSATEIERRDLTITGLFRVLDPVSFPATLQREGMGFSSALWSEVGAQGVAKMGVTHQGSGLALEGRLYPGLPERHDPLGCPYQSPRRLSQAHGNLLPLGHRQPRFPRYEPRWLRHRHGKLPGNALPPMRRKPRWRRRTGVRGRAC